MPAKAAWLLNIPEIVALLESFVVPVVDRAIVERLFGLRRRRAIELLHHFGGYQAGRTFLIDRKILIEQLQRLAEGDDFQMESRRKERLVHQVDQLRRIQAARRVIIAVEPEPLNRNIAGLSTGVALQPGHLHITFAGAEDLLSKLYELSQAANNDFDRFRSAAEPAEHVGR